MHPQISSTLNWANPYSPKPNDIVRDNAEKVLNYIEDINLERSGKFVPTATESLYMLWNVEDWEFHMECAKNGRVIYNFCKSGNERASGSQPVDKFINYLQGYLLMGVL